MKEPSFQLFADDPLQIRAGMQKMLPLSVGHIQGHLVPWQQEMLAMHRGRPQQIIFIILTANTRYAKSTLTHQRCGPGQKIRQGLKSIELTHWGHP